MNIDFEAISPIFLFVGIAALIFFAVQIYYYLYYFSGVILHNSRCRQGKTAFNQSQPAVSVIICARNEEDNLREFLPKVLEQNYPSFEVIVVNDASEDNSELVLNAFVKQYANLYVTNIPPNTNIISRKKLAITIGVKAAKNEVLLFTDADCYPESSNWISLMVENLVQDTEFVVGYGDYITNNSLISRLISYDTLFVAIQYLGFAFRGKPYMAVGRNLMYRKSTFYRNKGFAGHLHLVSGDDDLLINKGGTSTNTAIATKAESKTMSVPEPNFSKWIGQKSRHLTASSLYTKQSKQAIGIEVLSRGLFYLCIVLSVLSANIYLVCGAVSLFLIRYIIQMIIINKTAKQLKSRMQFFTVLLFDILLPIISLVLMLSNKFNKKKLRQYA